jgi:hypothetical protein
MNFEATHFKDKIIFKVKKTTIPLEVENETQLSKVIADYLCFLPEITIFNEGFTDSYFCMVCQLFSDAKSSPMDNGEFGFAKYTLEKKFELSFELLVIIKDGKASIRNLKIEQ